MYVAGRLDGSAGGGSGMRLGRESRLEEGESFGVEVVYLSMSVEDAPET
jgi:hypothetical protein